MRILVIILILLAPLSAIVAAIYEIVAGKQEPVLYLLLAVIPGAFLGALKELKDSGLVPPNRLDFEVDNNGTNVQRWWYETDKTVQLVTRITIPIRISNSNPNKTIDILDVSVEQNGLQIVSPLPEFHKANVDDGRRELFNDGKQKTIEPEKIKDYEIRVYEYDEIRDGYKVFIKFRDNWRRKYLPDPVTINTSDPFAEEFLITSLENEKDKNIRQAAVKILGKTMGSEAAPVLGQVLKKDKDSDVRYTVVVALGPMESGGGVVSALSTALRDQEIKVAKKAAELLGEKGNNETAINSLIREIENYKIEIEPNYRTGKRKEVAVNAAWAIGEIIAINATELGREVVLEAIWTLTKALDVNHKEFGGALTRIGYNETAQKIAMSELAKFLNDKNLFQVAANGIIYLGGKFPEFNDPDAAKRHALSIVEQKAKNGDIERQKS